MTSMNRLSPETRRAVIAALVEGNSIRATCRLTGVAKATVMKFGRKHEEAAPGDGVGGGQLDPREREPSASTREWRLMRTVSSSAIPRERSTPRRAR
jgi:transposase-like protein